MRYRLLCVLPDLDGGGAQRTMVNLVGWFAGCDMDVRLAVGRTGGPAHSWLKRPDLLIDLGCRRTIQMAWPLARLVRRWNPDMVFSTMADANVLASLATIGTGAGLVVRETNSLRERGDLSALRLAAIGWAYRRADRVIALSSGVGRELVADCGLDPARVEVIPNPVDTQALTVALDRPRGHGRPTILAAGRLTRQKGFDLLMGAIAQLPRPHPRLVILGEGELRTELQALAGSLGVEAEMPGFVSDPGEWMAEADVFVLSSRWEGFGHVIVEAMASGAAVVSFDCPHGPADIIQHGNNGILVENGNVARLAEEIGGLLADPVRRHALAMAGQQSAARFQTATVAGRYLDLLTSPVPR